MNPMLPTRACHCFRSVLLYGILLLSFAVAPKLVFAQEIAKKKFLQHDKVIGSKECIECHESEYEAWKTTRHHDNINLHTNEKAAEIARNMGITSPTQIRTSGLCTQCHFTVQKQGAAPARAIDGVSCESCHGGAKNWLEIHNQGDRRESDDTQAARDKRVAESQKAGMLRPEVVSSVAENCFSCHIITDEKLVNVGGHPATSDTFDLVSWSEGEVRHNFFHSKGARNEPTAQNRQRVLYVVGAALSVEYHLRGLARAKEKADYGNAMGRGSGAARKKLNAIIEALGDSAPEELKAIHVAINVDGLLKFFNVEPLTSAADKVGEATKAFSANNDGSALGAIDSLIPSEPVGTPYTP